MNPLEIFQRRPWAIVLVLLLVLVWMALTKSSYVRPSQEDGYRVLEELMTVELQKDQLEVTATASRYIAALEAHLIDLCIRGIELAIFYASPALQLDVILYEPPHPDMIKELFDITRAAEDFSIAEETYGLRAESLRFYHCKQFGILPDADFEKKLQNGKNDLDVAVAFAREWVPRTLILTDMMLQQYYRARDQKDASMLENFTLPTACAMARAYLQQEAEKTVRQGE